MNGRTEPFPTRKYRGCRWKGKEVSTMGGILMEMESFAPVEVFFAGLILLALVATAILLGYTAEEESKGNRLFWAEWPLPGSGEPASPAVERESMKAA
ncbi:MAG: hypothetical protein A2Z26_01940 [Deltaproteobacteria bacterium RBG_16_66_15]|nr:MAG: hypothetical protein A2Z26_01940 [Deltaproteobacteria bacterium RBG_16_66_15]HAM34265.1 hypothetical protein [Deltaproteobacteria bacterium]